MLNYAILSAALQAKANAAVLLDGALSVGLTREQKKLILDAVSNLDTVIDELKGSNVEPVKIETTGRAPSAEEVDRAVAAAQGKDWNDPEVMRDIKASNEHKQVGALIHCPACNKNMVKERYNTNFCSNKGPANCKDAFYQRTQGDRHKKG
ncbi:hypothetical protein [Vibrio phage vB_ValS_PJ32]|nr:hypothetical protein [Vibrio phage vB_ValS_PJ32]